MEHLLWCIPVLAHHLLLLLSRYQLRVVVYDLRRLIKHHNLTIERQSQRIFLTRADNACSLGKSDVLGGIWVADLLVWCRVFNRRCFQSRPFFGVLLFGSQYCQFFVVKDTFRASSFVIQVYDRVFVDLTQLLRKLVEVSALSVCLGQRVSEFGHLQDNFDCFELLEKLVVHFLLSTDYCMCHFNFVLSEQSILVILCLYVILLFLHVLVQLLLFLSNQFTVHVDDLLKFFDLLCILLDPVCISLS